MRNKKLVFRILTCLVLSILFQNCTYTSKEKLLSQYPLMEVDSLCVHINSQFVKLAIHNKAIDSMSYSALHLRTEPGIYYPIGKFYIDKHKKKIAYLTLLKDGNNQFVHYSFPIKEGTGTLSVAKYDLLEGAREISSCAYIFDIDKDGFLDLAMITKLKDFEFSTEEVPNISKETRAFYSFKKGVMHQNDPKDVSWVGMKLIE